MCAGQLSGARGCLERVCVWGCVKIICAPLPALWLCHRHLHQRSSSCAFHGVIVDDFTAVSFSMMRHPQQIACEDLITVCSPVASLRGVLRCLVDSELTQVWSNQRHRVEVGELHVFGQVLGIRPQQTRQLGRAAARDVVLTVNESSPKPRGTGTQQHAAGPDKVLKAARKTRYN